VNKSVLKKVTVLGVIIAIILCGENTFALSIPKTGVNINIEKEWRGYNCGYTEPSGLVIKTEDQWREVWEKMNDLRFPGPEIPEIDFEKKMVIAVFMGKRSSGGYEIEIIKITRTEYEIVVEVKEKEPPAESFRTMALTQPYHMVVIKRFPLPERFQYP